MRIIDSFRAKLEMRPHGESFAVRSQSVKGSGNCGIDRRKYPMQPKPHANNETREVARFMGSQGNNGIAWSQVRICSAHCSNSGDIGGPYSGRAVAESYGEALQRRHCLEGIVANEKQMLCPKSLENLRKGGGYRRPAGEFRLVSCPSV
jgi:hypothetical protein